MAAKQRIRNEIVKILNSALKRKLASRNGYSRRSLARDLRVSPAFVTNILNGKKPLPAHRLKDFSRLLELDIHERQRLFDAAAAEAISDLPSGYANSRRSKEPLENRAIFEAVNAHFLSNWYNIALSEGIGGLEEGLRSVDQLQARLKLNQEQVTEALRCLSDAGIIERKDGKVARRDQHLYLPTGRSKREVRAFHEKMILKAREELVNKSSDADFHRRLITGFTFSVHEKDLEKLKGKLLEFLDSFTKEATAQPGTDVYQCNIQFFPLTAPLTSDRNRQS